MVNTGTVKKLLEWLTIISFGSIIMMPSIIMFTTPYDETSPAELRTLAQFPQWSTRSSILTYMREIETFIQDHFGLREFLLNTNSAIDYYLFNTTFNEDVIIGEDGWFFYNDHIASNTRMIDDYRGTAPPLTEEQLHNFRVSLEARRDTLAVEGIAYYFVIAPNKQTIYGQYVPDEYTIINDSSYHDQIMDYFAEHSDIEIIDLRPALIAASATEQVYFRHDTHWNSRGAWAAYQEIIQHVRDDFAQVPVLDADTIRVSPLNRTNYDLTRVTRLSNYVTETNTHLITGSDCEISLYESIRGHNGHEMRHRVCAVESNINLLFFHDSYGGYLMRYIHHSFPETVTIWSPYNQNYINQVLQNFDIDIVIEESLERLLYQRLQ